MQSTLWNTGENLIQHHIAALLINPSLISLSSVISLQLSQVRRAVAFANTDSWSLFKKKKKKKLHLLKYNALLTKVAF